MYNALDHHEAARPDPGSTCIPQRDRRANNMLRAPLNRHKCTRIHVYMTMYRCVNYTCITHWTVMKRPGPTRARHNAGLHMHFKLLNFISLSASSRSRDIDVRDSSQSVKPSSAWPAPSRWRGFSCPGQLWGPRPFFRIGAGIQCRAGVPGHALWCDVADPDLCYGLDHV